MEWTWFIEIIAVPVIGWLVYMVSKTKADLSDHKLHVAEKYVQKEDAEKAENKIYDMLKTLNAKLDTLLMKEK